jgi:hypothetical protein
MCDWDCNKGINNLNGIFSGVTRYNWWSEVIKYPEHCTIYIYICKANDCGSFVI